MKHRLMSGLLPLLALSAALLGHPAHSASGQVNLLANGSFEQPPINRSIEYPPDTVVTVPGWSTLQNNTLIFDPTWQPAGGQGQQMLLLGNGEGAGVLAQRFSTRPGQHYLLSGWMAQALSAGEGIPPEGRLQLFIDNQLLATIQHSHPAAALRELRWKLFARRFQAVGATTTLTISGAGTVLDGLAVTLSGGTNAPAPFFAVDLSQHMTQRLIDPMLSDGNDLIDLANDVTPENPLPLLRQVPFLLDGVVMVGPVSLNGYRVARTVEGIPIGRKAARLHFLHGNHYTQPPIGTQIGSYEVHYVNGTRTTIPLRYGVEIGAWWTYPSARALAPVAWRGWNEAATRWDQETGFEILVGRPLGIQLFMMTWRNPTPDVEIKSLDVTSQYIPRTPIALPFLVGLTGE